LAWEAGPDYQSLEDGAFRNQVNEDVGWDDDPKEYDTPFDGDGVPLPQGPIEVVDLAAIEEAAKAGKTTADYYRKAHQMKLESLKKSRAAASDNDPSKVVDLATASKRRRKHKKANDQVYALKDCYTTLEVGYKLFGSTDPNHIQPLYRSHWKNKLGAFQVVPGLKGSTLYWPKVRVDEWAKIMKQKLDR